MKYRIPALIAVVALVAICFLRPDEKSSPVAPTSALKVLVSRHEKTPPPKAVKKESYEISFEIVASSPTP